MDIEKLRKSLLENSDPDGPCIEDDLMQAAATALSPPNDPLTLEELRKMDGEPVYMTFPSDTGNQCGHWALVGTQRWGAVSLIYGCGWSSYESAVETLGAKFYRRPPEGEGDGAK